MMIGGGGIKEIAKNNPRQGTFLTESSGHNRPPEPGFGVVQTHL
jgi:hypothetical protein